MSDAKPEANSGGSRGQLLLDGKSDRRTFLKRSAIAGGVAMAALYGPPMCSTSGARTAYAAGTTAGGEGCTPGFWKQTQHFDDWVNHNPGDFFNEAFWPPSGVHGGDSPFPADATLVEVMSFEFDVPNWDRVLGAHAVAALLNAASPLVTYPYTEAQVIQFTQAAFATGGQALENQKDDFEQKNEAGCGL